MTTVRVEIVIPVEIVVPDADKLPSGCAVTAADVAAAAQRELGEWSDGRRPFSVEVMHNAASQIAQSAAVAALTDVLCVYYGGVRVRRRGGYWTDKGALAADTIIRRTRDFGASRPVADACNAHALDRCPDCSGLGWTRDSGNNCNSCNGSGHVRAAKTP